jgi:chlorite dismutase
VIVSDVVTRVRRTFGDEAAVQVQDADIIRWINDGQIEIVKNNDAALQKTAFINLVAGQASYTLPTDMLLLRSLRYKMTGMLSFLSIRYKNMQEFDDSMDGWDGSTYTNSSPVYFTMYEGKAILFPAPDQSVTSGL